MNTTKSTAIGILALLLVGPLRPSGTHAQTPVAAHAPTGLRFGETIAGLFRTSVTQVGSGGHHLYVAYNGSNGSRAEIAVFPLTSIPCERSLESEASRILADELSSRERPRIEAVETLPDIGPGLGYVVSSEHGDIRGVFVFHVGEWILDVRTSGIDAPAEFVAVLAATLAWPEFREPRTSALSTAEIYSSPHHWVCLGVEPDIARRVPGWRVRAGLDP